MTKPPIRQLHKNILLNNLKELDFAFQPIVDLKSGKTIAFESFLTDYEKIGFKTRDELLDDAYKNKTLYALDILMREKILIKLKKLYDQNSEFSLFYNLDNRILEMQDYKNGITKKLLSNIGYKNDFFTFEISEKHQFESLAKVKSIFNHYSKQGFNITLDNFCGGCNSMQILYTTQPQYVKLDGFFIENLDSKKKILLESMINLIHKLNIKSIVNNIETKEQLDFCKKIGCDYVQGSFVQKRTKDLSQLQFNYKLN